MPATAFDQWSTAVPLIRGYPQWVGGQNATRIAAYQLYEEMYWNVPEAFKLIQRGADSKPIYVPAAKQIVETMHRYLAPRMSVIADPDAGSSSEQEAANIIMKSFARRERLYSTFSTNKRYGLIRGDWLFHIHADPEREEGSRISLVAIDPASYFTIVNEDNIDEIIGVHLVEQVTGDDDKPRIYRQTYRKLTEKGGPSPITLEAAIFEADAWGGPDMEEKRVQQVIEEYQLPEPINQIPVYHIQNFSETGTEWGSSELRGLESLIGHINQSISDEELELVMNGLGVYVTDAGSPVDEEGEPAPWNLGPAKVIETATGKVFKRVSSDISVTPYQDHLKYLHEQLDGGSGVPAEARGHVEVQAAESGIHLLLTLAPIISKAEEKEQIVTDVMTNLLFDLRAWFIAFESTNIGEALWIPSYGERIPENKAEKFDQILKVAELLVAGSVPVVSAEWVRKELTKLGYEFGTDAAMLNQIAEELTVVGQVQVDVTGARIDQNLGGE